MDLRLDRFVEWAWLSLICDPAINAVLETADLARSIVYSEQIIRESRWREFTGHLVTREQADLLQVRNAELRRRTLGATRRTNA